MRGTAAATAAAMSTQPGRPIRRQLFLARRCVAIAGVLLLRRLVVKLGPLTYLTSPSGTVHTPCAVKAKKASFARTISRSPDLKCSVLCAGHFFTMRSSQWLEIKLQTLHQLITSNGDRRTFSRFSVHWGGLK